MADEMTTLNGVPMIEVCDEGPWSINFRYREISAACDRFFVRRGLPVSFMRESFLQRCRREAAEAEAKQCATEIARMDENKHRNRGGAAAKQKRSNDENEKRQD